GAKSRLKRKQSLKHTSESKTEASKSKTGQSEKETQSSSAKDKIPSHPSPPTLVVGEINKEAQQAAGGPTSLGATSEEGAHPQLNSRYNASTDFTAKYDPGTSSRASSFTGSSFFSSEKDQDFGLPSKSIKQATASPTEGEKNTNPATKDVDPNLHDELVDLLGIDVVTQYYNKKLLYDKYYDKMLKRRKSSKITNCDVLTQKGPISLKVYKEDD
ncbi:hypothetical protein Tco_1227899, partial [Tanacetum coccineum]